MRAGQERKTLMQNFDSFWEEKKMYGFDNETFLSVLHGAVDNIETIGKVLDQAEEKGYENVFLIGTGGTYSMLSPLSYLLKTNGTLE